MSVLHLLAAMVAIAAPGDGWSHTFVGLPDEVVEGTSLKFRVAYQVPAEAGAVPLHVEAKNQNNEVLLTDVRELSGSGTASYALPIRPGVFRRTVQIAVWFGESWQNPRAPIVHSAPVAIVTASQAVVEAKQRASAVSAIRHLGLTRGKPAVAVLSGGWAGRDASLALAYTAALRKAGHRVVVLGPDEASNTHILSPDRISLYVIPQAETYPGKGLEPLRRYARTGGHLIALGAPAFDRIVQKIGGKWLDNAQLTEQLRSTKARVTMVQMAMTSASGWRRSSNDLAGKAIVSVGPGGANAPSAALHVRIGNLTGWETYRSPAWRVGPGTQDTLLTFAAKGGPATTALVIEVGERDGSRWMATVPLSTGWRRYAVGQSSFTLWDPDHKSKRGGLDDSGLSLSRAASVTVGLAFSHARLPGGKHEFWVSDIGAAPGPKWDRYEAPVLDTLSPAYKCYPVRHVGQMDGSAGALLVGAPVPAAPSDRVLSTHPRAAAVGFDRARRWRWIPLIQTRSGGEVRGTAATLIVHRNDGFRHGRWASLTVADPAYYRRPDVQRYVVALAEAMISQPMLVEGGSQYFGYFPDEPVRLGARVAGPGAAGCKVRIAIRPAGGRTQLWQRTLGTTADGGERVASAEWTPLRLTSPRYLVVVDLLRNGKVVDHLAHEVTVRVPKPESHFVSTSGTQFVCHGKIWRAHGVNYMPSSGIGMEDGNYFEQWMSSEAYDPQVIERDLKRVQAMGFNMVSAFVYAQAAGNHNLVDFLNRCDAHGLKVNLSLRPGTPLAFEWPAIGTIITANRLAYDDTIIAYDLAWEPAWGGYDQRKSWDGEWRRWIADRYGSVENAERDWGCSAPRAGGQVTSLSDADVSSKSTVARMAAAYRRFLDDFLSRKHMEARQKIRTVDPRHLLSFRMSIAGDPTAPPESMAYDFTGLARNMDFVSPEGYGRIGDRQRVKPGWFTVAYGHAVAPNRPVVWAEFGYTLWDPASASPAPKGAPFAEQWNRRWYPPATIKFTDAYYRAFYDIALKSGASGTICWWYPGGFRVGENSDFGVIEPDGTWRSLSRIIKAYSVRFADNAPKSPDTWIEIDRDKHPDGLYGIYQEVGKAFWSQIQSGHMPGLRVIGTGTTSANAPLVAVGGAACNGQNPPRFLNAEFERLEIQSADGTWVPVPYEGATIDVNADKPIEVRAILGNTGVAEWLAGATDGGVVLSVTSETGSWHLPLPASVPHLGQSAVVAGSLPADVVGHSVIFDCQARGRVSFGEKRRVLLRAATGAR